MKPFSYFSSNVFIRAQHLLLATQLNIPLIPPILLSVWWWNDHTWNMSDVDTLFPYFYTCPPQSYTNENKWFVQDVLPAPFSFPIQWRYQKTLVETDWFRPSNESDHLVPLALPASSFGNRSMRRPINPSVSALLSLWNQVICTSCPRKRWERIGRKRRFLSFDMRRDRISLRQSRNNSI
jgi:hypothetical protein